MSILSFFKYGGKIRTEKPLSFYDLSCTTIDGEDFDFNSLRDKKVLIVNVASNCGYTPQYQDLEKLYKEFREKDFIILGFPCNDFFSQESGSNEEIKAFCWLNYGITFPIMSKIRVKGMDKHIVYKWLTTKDLNGISSSKVKWNFQKYLINRNGILTGIVAPGKNPYTKLIVDFINS